MLHQPSPLIRGLGLGGGGGTLVIDQSALPLSLPLLLPLPPLPLAQRTPPQGSNSSNEGLPCKGACLHSWPTFSASEGDPDNGMGTIHQAKHLHPSTPSLENH